MNLVCDRRCFLPVGTMLAKWPQLVPFMCNARTIYMTYTDGDTDKLVHKYKYLGQYAEICKYLGYIYSMCKRKTGVLQ